MAATPDVKIRIRSDGLEDVRRADFLLARIESRLTRIAERAQELGIEPAELFRAEAARDNDER